MLYSGTILPSEGTYLNILPFWPYSSNMEHRKCQQDAFPAQTHLFHMMKMRERLMAASIKRNISGHYTANPNSFRKLVIWIIAFVDHFIGSLVPIPSYFCLLWIPLQSTLSRCFCCTIFYFSTLKHSIST